MEVKENNNFSALVEAKEPAELYANGISAVKALSSLSNSYGRGRVTAAYNGLTPFGKKRIRLAIAMAGHAFAMEEAWRRANDRGPRWFEDERIKASKAFACEHDGVFFEMLTNEGVLHDSGCEQYFPHAKMSLEERRAYNDSWLNGFMDGWLDTHSTLKQIIFGEMMHIFHEEGLLECQVPRFPMI